MKDAAEVMQVKCTRTLQVGDSEGWLVSGPGGESAYAWDGCVLRAGRMGAMTFEPPIGVLQGDQAEATWDYTGTVTARSVSGKATARLTQQPAKGEGRFSDALRVRMVIDLGDNSLEVVTTYARDVGIIEQEQRNNGRTVSRAQLTNDSG
jgi:hypothetical protein